MDGLIRDLLNNSAHSFLVLSDNIEISAKKITERLLLEAKENDFIFRLFSPVDTGIDEAREFRVIAREKSAEAKNGTVHLFVLRSPSYEVFHTLLKSAEEPSSDTKIIFLTTELAKIPETFLSRVRLIKIKEEIEVKKSKTKEKDDKDGVYRKIYKEVMSEIENFSNKTNKSNLVAKIKALSFLKTNAASIKMIGENLDLKN